MQGYKNENGENNRIRRFGGDYATSFLLDPKIISLEDELDLHQILNHHEGYETMEFNLIQAYPVTLTIPKMFYNKLKDITNETNFKQFLHNFKQEIETLSYKYGNKGNNNLFQYFNQVNEKKFLDMVLKVFTDDSFLFTEFTKILRNCTSINMKDFDYIKYFYISLCVAFNYAAANKPHDVNDIFVDEDMPLYVYRTLSMKSELVKTHLEGYKKGAVKLINEFLSCSRSNEISNSLTLNDNEVEFLYEILVQNDGKIYNYADISQFSCMKSENEVILRSGILLVITDVIPIHEKNYLVKMEVVTMSTKGYLNFLSSDEANMKTNNLTELEFEKKELGTNPENLQYLSELITSSRSLSSLYLGDNNFGNNLDAMKTLTEALCANTSISELYLNENDLGANEECVKYLSEVIQSNKKITILGLDGNQLGNNPEYIKCLVQAFSTNNNLTEIYLFENNLGRSPDAIRCLSEFIQTSPSLTTLGLEDNQLGSKFECVKYLCDAIKVNTVLTSIHLGKNMLGCNENTMQCLGDALRSNLFLKEVYIYENDIGGECSEYLNSISEVLQANTGIKLLDLGENEFGQNEDAVKCLADAIKVNTTLKYLYLVGCNLGDNVESMKHLSQAIEVNSQLLTIGLGSNNLGDNPDSMRYLSNALKANNNLTRIDLELNRLGSNPESFRYLSEALTVNKTLTALDLHGNQLSSSSNGESMTYLAEALQLNKSLSTIDLGENESNVKLIVRCVGNKVQKK